MESAFYGFLTLGVIITVVATIYLQYFYIKRPDVTVYSIDDTPRSKIRSAAQGYVEIHGVARPYIKSLISPVSNKECLWYSFFIHAGNLKSIIAEENSYSPFILEDETGTCILYPGKTHYIYGKSNPDFKNVNQIDVNKLPARYRKRIPKRKKIVYVFEELIQSGDDLVVAGEFKTYGKIGGALNLKDETRNVMLDLFRNKEELMQKWDINKDGKLEKDELEKIHDHAWEKATEIYKDNDQYSFHTVRRPADKKYKYIICVGNELQIKRDIFVTNFNDKMKLIIRPIGWILLILIFFIYYNK